MERNKTFVSKEVKEPNVDTLGAELYCDAQRDGFGYVSDLYDENLQQSYFNNEDEAMVTALNESGNEVIHWALSALLKSETAQALITEISEDDWTVVLDSIEGPDFLLDVPAKTICLNNNLNDSAIIKSQYFSNVVLLSLVRALRDAAHENRNQAFDEVFSPENILIMERVRAADTDIISVLVAWELRCADHIELWRHLLGSDKGDLAMRFSGYLEHKLIGDISAYSAKKEEHIAIRKALAVTFTQWFNVEERINLCDHETLEYMDDILMTSDAPNPFGNKAMTMFDIERLSCLPDKTAYLQGLSSEIINDPLYAGMNDEVNQHHLMHIIYDTKVVYVQNVPFRDHDLAMRIFPNGSMTPDFKQQEEETI